MTLGFLLTIIVVVLIGVIMSTNGTERLRILVDKDYYPIVRSSSEVK